MSWHFIPPGEILHHVDPRIHGTRILLTRTTRPSRLCSLEHRCVLFFSLGRMCVRTLKSFARCHFRANRFNGNVEVSVRRCDGTGQKRRLRTRTRSSICSFPISSSVATISLCFFLLHDRRHSRRFSSRRGATNFRDRRPRRHAVISTNVI